MNHGAAFVFSPFCINLKVGCKIYGGHGVKTESHVLIECEIYFDLTHDLLVNAANIVPNFNGLCSFDKFCVLMSNELIQIDTAKSAKKF